MADDTRRTEEENDDLRRQIEEVQQQRREGFAKAEELSRSVSAKEENERLREVLANQKRVLEREEKIRGDIGSTDEPVNDAGLTPSTPYTYTPEGPIVSDDTDQDVDRDGEFDLNEEN